MHTKFFKNSAWDFVTKDAKRTISLGIIPALVGLLSMWSKGIIIGILAGLALEFMVVTLGLIFNRSLNSKKADPDWFATKDYTLADPKHLGKFTQIAALRMLLVTLGTIAFIIPGIYLGLMFSQANYLFADDVVNGKETRNVWYYMQLSAQLMKGSMWRFLVVMLSLFGWALLAVVTLGIGLIFYIPYASFVKMNFYSWLIKSYKKSDLTKIQKQIFDKYKDQDKAPVRKEITTPKQDSERVEKSTNVQEEIKPVIKPANHSPRTPLDK